MTLAAGTLTSGKTGALATISTNASPTLRYLPASGFNGNTARGDDLLPLINNAGYAANKVKGLTVGTFDWSMPLISPLMNADFFTRAVGSASGDNDGTNYHTHTMYPDNQGGTGIVYAQCKFGGMRLGVSFSPNGVAQVVGIYMSGLSADPESGTVTALAAPSSGALSTSGALGYAQTTITGSTNVVSFNLSLSTVLSLSPGVVPGTNSAYPYLPKGLIQTDMLGTVTVTQIRSAGTVLGANGADGSFVLSIGGAGAGLSLTIMVMPLSIGRPSTLGANYMTSTYALKSTNGTSAPVVFADL